MDSSLQKLVDKAKSKPMTDEERETQRQSFAYGNTHFENEKITRETVSRASKKLNEERSNGQG
jgi:hypothetical protein